MGRDPYWPNVKVYLGYYERVAMCVDFAEWCAWQRVNRKRKKKMDPIEVPFGAQDSELQGWEYTIPEGYVAKIVKGKIIVKRRVGFSPRLKEGEYRCKHCIHFVLGFWSHNPKYRYKTYVCDKKPKKHGDCFYSCHDYGKPCENFELKGNDTPRDTKVREKT